MVYVNAVDANGTTVPDFENETRFSVKGRAEIAGDGEEWTYTNPVRLESGASGVLLRAGKETGAVILRAETEGLELAEIVLQTTPYKADVLDYTVQASDDGKTWDTAASGRSSGPSHVLNYFASPTNKRCFKITVEGVSWIVCVGGQHP
jgi:hypothetical protein